MRRMTAVAAAAALAATMTGLLTIRGPGTARAVAFSCSGTLVAPQWMVTAGHCSPVPGALTAGPDGSRLRVVAVHSHPRADVALVKLEHPIAGVRPVPIADVQRLVATDPAWVAATIAT